MFFIPLDIENNTELITTKNRYWRLFLKTLIMFLKHQTYFRLLLHGRFVNVKNYIICEQRQAGSFLRLGEIGNVELFENLVDKKR